MPPLRAALPQHPTFDPYNSSATGHQRAESRLAGSTSWRESRTQKLSHQFAGGLGGGKRTYDTVGAGSKNFGREGRNENRSWEKGARGLREREGVKSGLEGWLIKGGKPGVSNAPEPTKKTKVGTWKKEVWGEWGEEEMIVLEQREKDRLREEADREVAAEERQWKKILSSKKDDIGGERIESPNGQNGRTSPGPDRDRKVFHNLSFYLNGSTYPVIGDYKLKRLIAEHGGRMNVALGRKSVTHVILGRPNGCVMGGHGAGGGLAATKIEKEIKRIGGVGVKFVGVEWVLGSIKAGARLPEARFSNLKLCAKGQESVLKLFDKTGEAPQ
ncbi:hypothetical protein MMC25_003065 [Agyrium rufum]|nr:hypothetical protein [Agyrium rufum]